MRRLVQALAFLLFVGGLLAGAVLMLVDAQLALRYGAAPCCLGALGVVLGLDPQRMAHKDGTPVGPVGKVVFYAVFVLLFGIPAVTMLVAPQLWQPGRVGAGRH